MTVRLAGVLATLLSLALFGAALGPVTGWLIVPGHLAFSAVCVIGGTSASLVGHGRTVRFFGWGYLVGTIGMVVGLSLGEQVENGSWYWIIPWALVLLWGWLPPLWLFALVPMAEIRASVRTKAVVARRRLERRSADG
jgi:hypothetical protein